MRTNNNLDNLSLILRQANTMTKEDQLKIGKTNISTEYQCNHIFWSIYQNSLEEI